MKQIYMLPPPAGASSHVRMTYSLIQLPEEQRLIVSLFHHEQLSLEEIARVLGQPEDDVAAMFYEAYAALGLCGSPDEVLQEELAGAN